MEKIRILQIIKSLGRGGAEMLLPETLKIHDQNKFDFHYIYFLPWKNQMVEDILLAGGKVTCMPAKNNLKLLLQYRNVAAYIRQHKIQLIHAHLPWAGVLARIVGRMTGVPVIYTEHNKQERYHFSTRFLNLRTMNWTTCVVAVSADVADSIKKNKTNVHVPVKTILNGVNTKTFSGKHDGREAVKKKFGIPADAHVIGTIAVFRFQKRLDLWVELASKILQESPDVHFIIVGDGPLKNTIIEKIRALNLEERVHLAGLQTEVRPYLAAFDIYMITSIFEGLPIALLEAMASKCPIITTDAGGIKEVIRHDTDGLLCPVDEPERLVSFAKELLQNDDRRAQLGINARERIEEQFSLDAMVDQLELLYSEIVENTRY